MGGSPDTPPPPTAFVTLASRSANPTLSSTPSPEKQREELKITRTGGSDYLWGERQGLNLEADAQLHPKNSGVT